MLQFGSLIIYVKNVLGFPGGSVVKNLPANAGDADSIPGLGIPWSKKWHSMQYSCPRNPRDSGAWQAVVHEVTMSQTQLGD